MRIDDDARRRLGDLLLSMLRAEPGGFQEHALLKELRRRRVPFFEDVDLVDPLQMFQAHFFLFHVLYLIKSDLRARGEGELRIHCLDIRLGPPAAPPAPGTLEEADPLAAYYTDLGNMEGVTREEVQGMIRSFWQHYDRLERAPEAYATLGLSQDASHVEVKSRYRELARSYHPDLGGDVARFREITAAARAILGD